MIDLSKITFASVDGRICSAQPNAIGAGGKGMQHDRLEREFSTQCLPLSQAQLSIWLVQMLDRNDSCYNIAECVEILGAVDEHCFEDALREAVAKNDAWHIRIAETENGPRQYFHFDPAWQLDVRDFSNDASPRESAQAWMEKDRGKAFSLATSHSIGMPCSRFLRISIIGTRLLTI